MDRKKLHLNKLPPELHAEAISRFEAAGDQAHLLCALEIDGTFVIFDDPLQALEWVARVEEGRGKMIESNPTMLVDPPPPARMPVRLV